MHTSSRFGRSVLRALGAAALTGGAVVAAAGPCAHATEAGAGIQGLTVVLQAEQTSWPAGGAMTLQAVLTNVTGSPVAVDMFGDLNELYQGKHRSSYLPSCWTLLWDHGPAPAGPRRGRYTLERDQFVRLAPGEATVKRLSLRLTGVPPGAYRVQLVYVPRAASAAFSMPNRWQDQHDLHERIWLGMAYSNEVTIEVRPAPDSAQPTAGGAQG